MGGRPGPAGHDTDAVEATEYAEVPDGLARRG
jgi:hypothetical protein